MSKHIVVTGAGGVLGCATIATLRRNGFSTTGVDLCERAAVEGDFIGCIDLTNAESARTAITAIEEFDGLVNIAGGFCWETIGEGSPQSWELMFQMNVMTALNASRAALPSLEAGGSIVNVGAAAALRADAGMGAYTASKSGVARLTESLAAELKSDRIRVNAVLPSIIDTPTNRQEMGEEEAWKWGTPSEVASLVAFLVSDAASGITGSCIPVMGRV